MLPTEVSKLYFVGIGGIGMSGIAEVLHNLGYTVYGSDITDNANVHRLRQLGIPVYIGHSAKNIGEAEIVVISTAIKEYNPEVIAARQRLIPVVRRSDVLAALMQEHSAIAVSGTHGKTTTTSMVAALLDKAGFDPTVINGGVINAYGTNARLGKGDWMVVEADESDGTFVRLPATVAVVTNISPEHLDFWGNFERVREAFYTFVRNVPSNGFAIVCLDHPEIVTLVARVPEREIITYGLTTWAGIRASNVTFGTKGTSFDVLVTDYHLLDIGYSQRSLIGVSLPTYGYHNVQNALAAIAVALRLGIDNDTIFQALASFHGVKRRFTCTGTVNGITIIDDYGHHPVEIAAVLRAARSICHGHLIAVVQPHRYTRLYNLFRMFCSCFSDADTVIVAEVYPAGESPIPGMHRDALVEGLRAFGHGHVVTLFNEEILAQIVHDIAKPGDFVICLGAGSITHWAHTLPSRLQSLGDYPTKV